MKVSFCEPCSPRRGGVNEKTNGLLRQYLPRGTDLIGYSQDDLDVAADALNGRFRVSLGWRKPVGAYVNSERFGSIGIADLAPGIRTP